MIYIEIVGMCASIILLISMSIKSTTIKGNMWMRIINIIGSILFVIYGINLTAYSTVFLNLCVIVVHLYYIIKLLKEN